MNAYAVVVPSKWKAGTIGGGECYFDCAGCGAKEPEIAGFLGTDARTEAIAIIADASGRPALALYCAACWEREGG